MNFAYVTHSLISCWNQGNAHFQRGILRALIKRGHTAISWEPAGSWSRQQLALEQDVLPEQVFRDTYPELDCRFFQDSADVGLVVDGADVVIVHEWTDPELVAAIGLLRRQHGFILLFHDTHHRAVSEPEAMRRYDLSNYDGVLAFGMTLAEVYRGWGWGNRAYVWHEAADITVFKPPPEPGPRSGAVWIGNWGDGERTLELENFLLAPAHDAEVALDIFGVRYPDQAKTMLQEYGARYHGWLPNASAPAVFARYAMTIHVPRCFYAQTLPGIPTIRVFESLSCAIPLITAPWADTECLFRPGEDFLVAKDGEQMRRHMLALKNDPDFASHLAANGRKRVLERHSCDQRVTELLAIVAEIAGVASVAA